MCHILLFEILFLLTLCDGLPGHKMIADMLHKPLELSGPMVVGSAVPVSFLVALEKSYFKSAYGTMRTVSSLGNCKWSDECKKSSVVFLVRSRAELEKSLASIDTENLGTKNPSLILLLERNIGLQEYSGIRINQLVYILDFNAQSLLSAYSVNGATVQKSVGYYKVSDGKIQFIKHKSSWKSMELDARDNFQGLNLVGMTNHEEPYTHFPPDYEDKSQYFESNQTFEVTKHFSGLYQYILDSLASSLNFTYTLYFRKDKGWGTVKDNKTSGMMINMEEGSAEFIAAALAMNIERAQVIDWLPPLTKADPHIFIKEQNEERVSWDLFISPFAADLWIAIVTVAVLLASMLFSLNSLIMENSATQKILDLFGWLWITFSANLGGKPKDPVKSKMAANKIVLFTCLMVGNIVFMGYRASITSELSVVKNAYPFNSLEGLLASSFTLGTNKIGTGIANVFTGAPKGSLYNQIYEKNMREEDSFIKTRDGLEIASQREDYAYFQQPQFVIANEEFHCKLVSVWKVSIPLYYHSIGIRKHSPYFKMMSQGINRMRENGELNVKFNRHLDDFPNCKPLYTQVKALGIKKLAMVFVILIFSFGLAFLVFVLESQVACLFKKKKKDDTFDKAAIEKTDDFLTKIELEELAKIKESIRTLKSTYKNSKITLREALSGLSPSDSIQKLLE